MRNHGSGQGRSSLIRLCPVPKRLPGAKRSILLFVSDAMVCKGEGDGNLYTSGLYPVKPRSLMAASAIGLKDGEIFHSITLGFGSMGAHGSQIKPDDRWKLVLYIRNLQEESQKTKSAGEGANK